MNHSLRLLPIVAIALSIVACAGLEPFRKVSCFEAARLSLTDAVAAAEQHGGKAIDADYRQDKELGCLQNNPGVYDVTLLFGNELRVVSVNADSGQVGPKSTDESAPDLGKHAIENVFGVSHEAKTDVVPDLSITISQAAAIAEQQGGKAMTAWADTNGTKSGYKVELVENGKTRTVWVDGDLGIARVPKMLAPKVNRRS